MSFGSCQCQCSESGSIVGRDETPSLGPGIGRDLLLRLGPLYFELIWNWLLLGTLIVQTYYYYLSFKRDSKWLKALVYTILLLDLVQAGTSAHTSFHTFVLYYGDPRIVMLPNKTIIGLPLFGGLVGGIVQLFYAWRIWALTRWAYKSVWLMGYVGVVVCTSLVSTVCAVTFAFIYLKIGSQAGVFATDGVRLFATWYAAGFAVDVLIAIAMVLIVTNAKTNTTFRKTNNLLTKILIRVVATGVMNALSNGLGVVFLYAWPLLGLAEVPAYLGGKLYSNMMLVSLNSRYTDAEAAYAQGGVTTTGFFSSVPVNGSHSAPLQFAPNFKVGEGTTVTLTGRTGTGPGFESGIRTGIERKSTSLQLDGEDIELREFEAREQVIDTPGSAGR